MLRTRLLFSLLAIIAIVAITVTRHPAPRALPPVTAVRVLYVQFADFPVRVADAIRNDITARYGLPGSILVSSTTLDPSAWNPNRRQFGAERAIDVMLAGATAFPNERTVVIGLTTADIYIESINWRWAFSARRGGAALVSMARMHHRIEFDGAQALMRKMVVRQLGFLVWGLTPTDDPGDLMYRNVLSLGDLIKMADDL